MVSISVVSTGQASSYYQQDNYYVQDKAEWQGEGASKLGLTGEVQWKDFNSAINGKAPDGSFTIQNGGAGQEHRAGVDLTFSAPKSVSVASEILGDTRIREAHERAVTETLQYIEQNYAQARQTVNGVTEKIDTGNLVIAKVQHTISRELDPQLHTHCIVMNMTLRPDGEWRALSNEQLFDNKMFIGQIYRNELAANLKELGYAIQSDSKGFFEIAGIDKQVLDHFSQRSKQIDEKMVELRDKGIQGNEQKLKEMAALQSREIKKDVDMQKVRESWENRLHELNYSKEMLKESIFQSKDTIQGMSSYEIVRQAAEIKTEQESVFTKEDVLKIAERLSVGEHRISELERVFKELVKDKEIRSLKNGLYTTKEMQKIENNIIKIVKSSQDKSASIVDAKYVEKAIRQFEVKNNIIMTEGQKKGVNHILTSKDAVIGVQGDAGTGKTAMLALVREQAEGAGYEVQGIAYTGKAADEIESASGIKSQTIDSFLNKQEGTNKSKQLWIVDETSMVGSAKMQKLLKAADKQGAKVVLIGDVKQLQSIEAGGIFQKLQEKGLATVKMTDITRQKEESYKDVVRDMANKRVEKAIEKLDKQGRLYEMKNREERLAAITKEYVDSKGNTIIVTSRNIDRNELNNQIHTSLKEQGKIGQQEYTFTIREVKNLANEEKRFVQSYKEGDIVIANKAGILGRAGQEGIVKNVDLSTNRIAVETKQGVLKNIDVKKHGGDLQVYAEKQQSFALNEKIVFTKNDKGLNIKNGQTGVVKTVDDKGRMTIKMDNGGEKKININSQYNYVDRGYAVTDYKSQGQTADKVIYHADTSKGGSFNQAYVAITRGKQDVRIYSDNKTNLKEQIKTEQTKTSTLDHDKDKSNNRMDKDKSDSGMDKDKSNNGMDKDKSNNGMDKDKSDSGMDR